MSVPSTRLRALVAAAIALATLLGLTVVATPAFARPAVAATGVTDTWTGAGDGSSWTDGANWDTGHAPNDGDSVSIAPPSHNRCAAHVDSVPAGVQVQDFTLTNASPLAGDTCLASISGGSIAVAGTFTAMSGVYDTAFTLLPGSTGTVTPFTGFPDTTEFDQDLTVHGVLTLDGNAPDANNADRDVSLSGAHSLVIASDGEVDAVNGNVVSGTSCCATQNHVTNNGLLRVVGGTLTTHAVSLDQNGTLDAENAARVISDFGPATAGDAATYTGNGSWATVKAADTTLTGTQNLGSAFHLILGGSGSQTGESLDGTFTLAGSGTFDWLGGELAANMTIAHGVTTNLRGSIATDGRELDGGPDATNPNTITNHGVLNFAAASLYVISNGAITNANDGTLYLSAGTSVDGDCCATATPNAITNAGGRVLEQNTSGTTPVTLHNVSYVQTGGTTSIPAGHSIVLSGGGASAFTTASVTGGGTLGLQAQAAVTRALTLGAGTTLALGDPSDNHGELLSATSAVASVNGPGAISWLGGAIGGTLNLATTGGVAVSGATHRIEAYNNGPSAVTINAPASVANGTKTVANEVDVDDNGSLTLAGASTVGGFVTFDHGRLVNTGSLTVKAATNAPLNLSSSSLTTRGDVSITGTVNCDGVYTVSGGTTNVAGTLAITGSDSSVKVLGGAFGGRGTVQGTVVNTAGQLLPGAGAIGTLTITGNYTQQAGGSTQVQVGSASTDTVAVGGRAYLLGELDVVNTGYVPPVGVTRTAFTSGSRPTLSLCTATTGMGSSNQHWNPSISGTSVVLTSVSGAGGTC